MLAKKCGVILGPMYLLIKSIRWMQCQLTPSIASYSYRASYSMVRNTFTNEQAAHFGACTPTPLALTLHGLQNLTPTDAVQ